MPRKKRRRGGQPGNQNARKHGFYSPYMDRSQVKVLRKMLKNNNNTDPVIAALRIKLNSALIYDPDNRRVIREASGRLYKWIQSKYPWDKEEKAEFRKTIRQTMNGVRNQVDETKRLISKIRSKKRRNQSS